MTAEIVFVFLVLAGALVLFWTDRVPFDVTAVVVMALLMLAGILTPGEGLSGFANEATVTIACMFVLSEGVRRTGALAAVSGWFLRAAERGLWTGAFAMMASVAVLSAFINNTAAVAIFIPVTLDVAGRLGISPTRLLMPLSFAAMLGGVCTLIGTSTNLLVSSIAVDHGEPPFTMFEFAPLGLPVLLVGFAYLLIAAVHMLPERRPSTELTEQFAMNEYLTDLRIEPGWEHVGRPLGQTPLGGGSDVDVVHVFRGDGETVGRDETVVLEAGDILRIRGGVGEIRRLLADEHLRVRPAREWHDVDLNRGDTILVEAVIAPESELAGRTLGAARLTERFDGIALAVRHRGRMERERLDRLRLDGGDSLLLAIRSDRLAQLELDRSFVVVTEVETARHRREKLPWAVGILAAVVLTAASGLVSIVVSALAGVALLLLTGCLEAEEAYEAINWRVILLLAGILPLGLALDKTGAAELMSGAVLDTLGTWGPTAVLAGFLLLAMALTNLVSNQAAAVLLAPIAIQSARTLDVSPRPLLVAVTVAASLSFMSPVSYQTNTLVYGPGQYRFGDFVRVGTPLNVALWVLASLLIPLLWSF